MEVLGPDEGERAAQGGEEDVELHLLQRSLLLQLGGQYFVLFFQREQ